MANILQIDPDLVAQKALKGILARGDHRLVSVASSIEAWEILRRSVKVDLVITELRLKGDTGVSLVQRLKSDCFFKDLPVVVYTGCPDRASVRRALELHVQNLLVKPYRDESVLEELEKSASRPWWRRCFGSPKIDITPEKTKATLESLVGAIARLRSLADQASATPPPEPFPIMLGKLANVSDKIGANAIRDCFDDLKQKAINGKWPDGEPSLEPLLFAERLIADHLDPTRRPEDFRSTAEIQDEIEAQQRASWINAPAEGLCPVIGWDQIKRELDNLNGCPVIDSIAASYQMSATGHPTSLSPLLDLVKKDPGLTAQILIEANRLNIKKDDGNAPVIEDPRMAIGLLGENRLASVSAGIVSVEERLMDAPPHSSWPQFRMFQLGTAHLARFVCDYLEMPTLMSAAYTAGLIHDIGKLLLIKLHPFAFQAIHDFALARGMKLQAAERYFLETTTHEMAAYFAEKQRLPKRFVNVLRYLDNPDEASDDRDLVAIVSLARDLCRHNHVGFCGDTPKDDAVPLEETPEWGVLRSKVYINFDLKKFELQAHRECLTLKRELLGLVASRQAVA